MSLLSKYFGGDVKALQDGIVKTVVQHDPRGAMQAEIQEGLGKLHKLAGLAAEAAGKAQADAAQVAKLQGSFNQHLTAADSLTTQISEATDPAVGKAKQTALDKILADAEHLKRDLDSAKTSAAESRSDADELKKDADTARERLEASQRELTTAIHEQDRAQIEAKRAEERRETAERTAGLVSGLSSHDVALQALHSNTELAHKRALAATMTADGLEGNSSADAEVAAALRAASGEAAAPTTAADRLKALRGE